MGLVKGVSSHASSLVPAFHGGGLVMERRIALMVQMKKKVCARTEVAARKNGAVRMNVFLSPGCAIITKTAVMEVMSKSAQQPACRESLLVPADFAFSQAGNATERMIVETEVMRMVVN